MATSSASKVAAAKYISRSDEPTPLEARPFQKLHIVLLCVHACAAITLAVLAGAISTYTTPIITVVAVHDKSDDLIVALEQRGSSVVVMWFLAAALGASAFCSLVPVTALKQYYHTVAGHVVHIRHLDRALSYPPLMISIALVSGSSSPAMILSVAVITFAIIGFVYMHEINVTFAEKRGDCVHNVFWFIAIIPIAAVWAILAEPYSVVSEDTPLFVDMLFYVVPALSVVSHAFTLRQAYIVNQTTYNRWEIIQIITDNVFKLTIAAIIAGGALKHSEDVSGETLLYNGAQCIVV